MGKDITELNKDTFWRFIEEAKEQCGKDMDATICWLKERLLHMQPERALKFHAIMYEYKYAAHKYGLWIEASLMKGKWLQ